MTEILSYSSDNNGRLDTTTSASYICISPKLKPRPNFHVSTDFEQKLLAHIFKNFVIKSEICNINIPLILAIQGSQGDGKSSQVKEICSRHGIYIYPLSGSLLSGSHEKESLEILAKSYIQASSIAKNANLLITILIDDFDLSVASTFKDRQYTVNSQLLTGFLMNLADNPNQCGEENVYRIPVIVTGNNFTELYDPLTRHGRMDFFTWCPSFDQKVEIVSSMYSSYIKKEDQIKIRDLVSEFQNEPISFFDALKSDYLDGIVCEQMKMQKVNQSLNLVKIAEAVKSTFAKGLNVENLRKLANQRNAIQRKNYVKGSKTKDKYQNT